MSNAELRNHLSSTTLW